MAALSDGKLAPAEAAAVHAHVDTCLSCQWLLRELAGVADFAVELDAAPTLPSAMGQVGTPPVVLGAGSIVGGRYRLERLLGQGGMGTVYSAIHLGTDRKVACKLLNAGRIDGHAARLRFLREARLLGRVEHPNLVPVRDVFDEQGTPILVMDFLAGESLGARLRRAPIMDARELARLFVPALSAVHAAHAAGIIHRDLKPDNLFLIEIAPDEWSLRVLDFGVAKLLDEPTDDGGREPNPLTESGQIVGTPPYMAPEQLRGDDVDRRVDVWAFGVIFYQCLSGKRPFVAERLGQYFDRITRGERAPLAVVSDDLPEPLLALVEQMLTVDRDQRTNDLGEAIRVLSRLANHAADVAVEPPLHVAAPPLPLADPAPHEPLRRLHRRRPSAATKLLAVLILCSLAATAVLYEKLTAHPRPEPIVPRPPVVAELHSAASCSGYWPKELSARLCEIPKLAVREAAYRVSRTLRGDGDTPDVDLVNEMVACGGSLVCVEPALQRAARGIAIVDCAKAVSRDAIAICDRAPLATAAGTLAAHYQVVIEDYATAAPRLQRLPGGRAGIVDAGGAMHSVPSPTQLSADQTGWLGNRHRCGDNDGCLIEVMERRTAELATIHQILSTGR